MNPRNSFFEETLINFLLKDSSTSLHRAVYKNSSDMVQLLLENKANINAQDSFNRAPLHWSVVNPDVDCLKVYKSLRFFFKPENPALTINHVTSKIRFFI